jgi:hypothetical protein
MYLRKFTKIRRKAPTVTVLRSVVGYKAGDDEGIPDLC